MDTNRQYLRNPSREALMTHTPDQQKGVTPPPFEKPAAPGAKLIPLVPADRIALGRMPLVNAIRDRESRREFTDEALSLEELSFLLWATQGIRRVSPKGTWAMRNVPSGGCRHPFETYLRVRHVETLAPGLYRYLPVEHALVAVDAPGADPTISLAEACYGQQFVDTAAVSFVWTAIPYRTEWRYGPDSLKDILLSCGHICQNLYLACESIGAGTCAIVAYDQDELDTFLGVDGKDEISLYVAPVGKVAGKK
ncbi:MAG: SagB/ThcOx family dehydrogenase [Thermotogota bacterium]